MNENKNDGLRSDIPRPDETFHAQADLIRATIAEKRWTLEKVAKESELSIPLISNMQANPERRFKWGSLKPLADSLGLDVFEVVKEEYQIPNTSKDGLVLTLSGVYGDDFPRTPSAKILGELLRRHADQLGQSLDFEIWPWHKVPPSASVKNLVFTGPKSVTAEQSLVFARNLRWWRRRNPGKAIYLVAASGGGWITQSVCDDTTAKKPLLPPSFFQRIVLVSTVLPCDQDLTALVDKAKYGVFNYYSKQDKLLGYLSHPMLLGRVAGTDGFTIGSPELKQLQYSTAYAAEPYNCDGKHMACYTEGFLARFFLPLFSRNPESIPSIWA